ncbi:GAF domain-containing protein [Thermodesulfobacteriota bacterium]
MADLSKINKEMNEEISALKKRIKELEQSRPANRQSGRYQHLITEILGILNDPPPSIAETIELILTSIKRETDFDAVGIRLRSGEDFPYFVQNGFSQDFLLKENSLIARDEHGAVCKDEDGNISLECTCGLVITGQTDPANPLFTESGSAWTNNSLPLLDIPEEQDPRLHPRNNCIHKGYLSVALIPIRANREIVGLLQLNDRKENGFTPEIVQFFEGIAASIGVALMRKQTEEEREKLIKELQTALDDITVLEELLPICASCKNIRDDKGYWNKLEDYLRTHINVSFSHGICPECADKLYGHEDWYKKDS